MRKTAITLIVIGIVVLIGANLFIDSQVEPAEPVRRDDTSIRSTTSEATPKEPSDTTDRRANGRALPGEVHRARGRTGLGPGPSTLKRV